MIWELRNDLIGEVAILVDASQSYDDLSLFRADGSVKHWLDTPKVMPFEEKRKKKQKPRADISHLSPGSIVLNQRAYEALHDFLAQFGQLLELDCLGEKEYFYNVTNVIPALDLEKSEIDEGVVRKEKFPDDCLNTDKPVIFKDPMTVRARIYANNSARRIMEARVKEKNLTGVKFVEPGTSMY